MELFYTLQSLSPLINFAVSIGAACYAWWASRQKNHAAVVDGLRGEIERQNAMIADLRHVELSALKLRVSALEEGFKHLPDKDSMHRLEMTVEGVKGQLNVVAKSLESVDRIAQRIDTFLLENNRAA